MYVLSVFYVAAFAYYVHLLKTEQHWSKDDINTGYYNLCTALFTFVFLANMHGDHVTRVALRTSHYIDRFGWRRCLLFLITVSAAGYLLVNMAEATEHVVRSVSKDELVRRFEDNIHRITEDREYFEIIDKPPVTKGERNSKTFHKLFRYSMEDARMKCVHRLPWLSSASPFNHQLVWHHNGVPLTFSDRHSIKVTFTEVHEDNSLLDSKLRKYGISMYEIKSTLTIQLLKDSEFGSYTCHVAKFAKNKLKDYIKMMNKPTPVDSRKSVYETKRANSHTSKYRHAEAASIQWTDVYTCVHEFRLISLSRHQEPLRVAPGAILSFTTSYWHLGWRKDVEVDYSINGYSYHDLCPGLGLFHGCSKFLLLYWFFGDDIGWHFGIPPLHLFLIWKEPAEKFHLFHCLCSKSYGHHTVHYVRQYYNRTNHRQELIEIQHPHTLLVIPREQKMLDLFVNSSASSSTTAPPCCANLKFGNGNTESCAGVLFNELAILASDFFHWKELLYIALLCLVIVYALCKLPMFFKLLGRFIKCLTLHGSMGIRCTALMTFSMRPDPVKEQSSNSYDIYPSYSEAEYDARIVNDTVEFLERQGLKVHVRNRDGHPGMPEIQTISKALENSKRFLIFISQDYFRDRFRNDFEAAMIFETLSDRSPKTDEILLIRLNPCDIPLWLQKFPVHDWTSSNLSMGDHLHQLLKWLEPAQRKGTIRCALDLLVTLCPVMVVGVLLMILSSLNYVL